MTFTCVSVLLEIKILCEYLISLMKKYEQKFYEIIFIDWIFDH